MMEESWIEKRMRETAHPAGAFRHGERDHLVLLKAYISAAGKRDRAVRSSIPIAESIIYSQGI